MARVVASRKPREGVKLDLGPCVAAMREKLPENTIVCNGAGNFSGWWHRYWRYGPMPTQLAPTSGTMGYGLPAAVAAAIRFKDRPVVCVAGDGDFLMNGQELATAAQYGADLLVILVDNAQLRHDPHAPGARISEADLGDRAQEPRLRRARPRLSAAGRRRSRRTEDFAPALDRGAEAARASACSTARPTSSRSATRRRSRSCAKRRRPSSPLRRAARGCGPQGNSTALCGKNFSSGAGLPSSMIGRLVQLCSAADPNPVKAATPLSPVLRHHACSSRAGDSSRTSNSKRAVLAKLLLQRAGVR